MSRKLKEVRENLLEATISSKTNIKYIEEILKSGAEKVRSQTVPILKEVKKLVGISVL